MARAPQQQNNRREERNALVVHDARLPFPAEQANPLGINPGQWKTIVEAIWPSAKTVDGIVMALQYCKSRQLDPFKRPVHIVPMWNSTLRQEVETVWPGINDYRTTATRTERWAGNDDCVFGPTLNRAFQDSQERGRGNDKYVERGECAAFEFPEWAQVTVYKIVGGQRVAFVGPKVRFVEIFSGERGLRVPNARWRQAPFQMLEKCAEAAALRRAFPEELANSYTAEEMEGKDFRGPTIEATATRVDQSAGDDAPKTDDKPTRESVQTEWEKKGIPKDRWDEIEFVQRRIDASTDPDALRKAKEEHVDRAVATGWTEAALDELELRFDTAIGKLEHLDEGLPLDGDNADASAGNDGSASEEDNEQTTD